MARRRKRKIVKKGQERRESGSKGGTNSGKKKEAKRERIRAARMRLVEDTPTSSRKKAANSDQLVGGADLEALKGYFASKKSRVIKTRFKLYL